MEDSKNSQSEPIGRGRLYLFAAIMVLLFTAITIGLEAGAMIYIFRALTRVVAVTSDGRVQPWNNLGELPGIPDQLEASTDGSLWTSTRLMGSISRYRDGKWQVFRSDSFGTTRNSPRHDFVVAGNRLWAVVDDVLLEFDGEQWLKHRIPNAAADHVVAANEDKTWVLGNDGVLRTWAGGRWHAEDKKSNVEGTRWDSQESFRAPSLLAADDGGLWLCADQVWRRQREKWTPVKFKGRILAGVEMLGYAGGKIWLDDPLGLLWVTENAETSGQFSKQQLGLGNRDHIHGVYQLGEQVCASGSRGIHVLDGQQWQLKWPLPDDFYRCQAVATAGGRIYAIAIGPVPVAILWLVALVAALLCALGLLAIRLVLRPKYSIFKALGRRHLVVIALVTVPVVLSGVAGMSIGILPMLAPIAITVLLLLVPPMLTMMIVLKEKLQRSAEVMQLQRVTAAQMPPDATKWFEKNTPDVESLGFRRLGDYRLKRHSEHFARFFINPQGDIVAEIGWVKVLLLLRMKCFSCFSVTDDLTYLETGNLAVPEKDDEGRFILQSIPGATIDDTLSAHRCRLDELADTRRTLPICFVEDDLDKVIFYGQKLLYDRLTRRGVVAVNPYDEVTFGCDSSEPSERLVEAL